MVFSSFTFLSVFLPLVLLVYYLAPRRFRNPILLVASLVFYAWGDYRYLWVLLAGVMVSYVAALILERTAASPPWQRKLLLAFFVGADLAPLLWYKYCNFFVSNIAEAFHLDYTMCTIVMPLGISFYTFQSLSYIVDVYRGTCRAQRRLLDLTLYISFFPQLVAGPIVKYHDVAGAIDCRRESLSQFAYGLRRFMLGFAKKILFANVFGQIADSVYGTPVEQLGVSFSWVGALAYMLQIYFDFSAYSDMAIGLGAMFGFSFLENFDYPYRSLSITEFWRRWHISLSTWFKEYLYIPLGGNRVPHLRNLANLWIVFFLTGLWHGAEWTFVVWGLYHGAFIIMEKATGWHKRTNGPLLKAVHSVYLLLVVLIGWVFFRADNLSHALHYIATMFGLLETTPIHDLGFYLSYDLIIPLLLALPAAFGAWHNLVRIPSSPRSLAVQIVIDMAILLCFAFAIAFLAGTSYNPFIYFRF